MMERNARLYHQFRHSIRPEPLRIEERFGLGMPRGDDWAGKRHAASVILVTAGKER
jgi:hypothetical protein